jgi:hypothetical protein
MINPPQIKVFVLLLTIFCFQHLTAQEHWLVRVKGEGDCLRTWWKHQDFSRGQASLEALPLEGLWAITVPTELSIDLSSLPCVESIREDRQVSLRRTPNDPGYINQKDMNLIGMPRAWDIATGGQTPWGGGFPIVVAVIDDGFQIDHEDLAENIWYNAGEIPGDGIDNDGNGYIDDVTGFNATTDDGVHPVRSHGTSVCGIIGARGNNGKGVAGINWQVKMMLISGADLESRVLKSYYYVLAMRKKFRETQGEQGAFVVAVNLSSGIDNAFAMDHPEWCQLYDMLGEEGILSVCAAPNRSISVDIEGDMPTTCTSAYLLAVTNVDVSDQLVSSAGFGPVSIDIGAPGHGSITTAAPSQYKEFTGTSSATPHVTGVVALMYSMSCNGNFFSDIWTDPGGIALRIRNIILESAKPNETLKDVTVTGRRLQADAALESLRQNCGDGPLPEGNVHIETIWPNPVRAEEVNVKFFVAGDTATVYFELYSAIGQLVYKLKPTSSEFANGRVNLKVGDLPVGMYILTLRSGRDKVTRKLWVN